MRWMPIGHDSDAGASGTGASGSVALCAAGKFSATLDTLFNTLFKTHMRYIFCINPNDAHSNQLKGHIFKVQVRHAGLEAVIA